MTDWRDQLREFLKNQEARPYSWSPSDSDTRMMQIMFDDAESIKQFLEDIGFTDVKYDC